MIDAASLEPVARAAFPASVEHRLGDWVLRWDGTLPNRRVNSAWDLGDPGMAEADAVSFVQAWYLDRGRRPMIKTTPGSPTDTLCAHWPAEAATDVLTRPVEPGDHTGVTFLPREDLVTWCRAFVSVRDLEPERAVGLEAAYRNLPQLALAVAFERSSPAAVGLGVLDHPWIGLFDIATASGAHRRGLGSRVTEALVGWGFERGATHAYLQVEESNGAAGNLYRGLGFARSYGYHYRVRPTG